MVRRIGETIYRVTENYFSHPFKTKRNPVIQTAHFFSYLVPIVPLAMMLANVFTAPSDKRHRYRVGGHKLHLPTEHREEVAKVRIERFKHKD